MYMSRNHRLCLHVGNVVAILTCTCIVITLGSLSSALGHTTQLDVTMITQGPGCLQGESELLTEVICKNQSATQVINNMTFNVLKMACGQLLFSAQVSAWLKVA